jgi:2-hydroxy-3-oxopropionate reductase
MTGKINLGFIGLGAMGTPMAKQILQKHGQVTICDIDHAAVERLRAVGATAAASPREVAANSDIVVTMLPHPDVLRTVALGEDGLLHGMRSGSTLIDMGSLAGYDKAADAGLGDLDWGAVILDDNPELKRE